MVDTLEGEEVHFVWTQLKINDYLNTLKPHVAKKNEYENSTSTIVSNSTAADINLAERSSEFNTEETMHSDNEDGTNLQ